MCAPCAAAAAREAEQASTQTNVVRRTLIGEPAGPCRYSEQQLREWKRMLTCLKGSEQRERLGVDNFTINQSLGIVGSALNHSYNICYFEPHLDNIEPLIFTIINENICL